MSQIEQFFKISKRWAKSFLRGEDFDHNRFGLPLNEKEKREIEEKLNQKSYWKERNAFLESIDVNKEWKSLEAKLQRKKSKYSFFRYAAVLVMVIGVASFFLFQNHQIETVETQTIAAGTNEALLTLENGEEIVLQNGISFRNTHALLSNNRLQYQKEPSEKTIQFNYLTIPRGGQFQIELADGTLIWLNSESKLKYPVSFIPGQIREVELLYGEAYFEVSPSTEHHGDHYRVITNDQKVEVLGTKFNIRAYKEEDIYTTLAEGSVAISKNDQRELLSPGEQGINSGRTRLFVKPVKVEEEIAWKNGMFMFEQEKLSKMMTELSRWYDMEVIFENKQKQSFRFSGVLNREEHVSKLLRNLEKTNEVKFEIIGKTIHIR